MDSDESTRMPVSNRRPSEQKPNLGRHKGEFPHIERRCKWTAGNAAEFTRAAGAQHC